MTVAHPLVRVKRLEAIEKRIRDRLGDVAALYAEVRRDRLYEAAGFDTPEAWATDRFGERWVKLLPPDARREIHAEKREEGKSSRAIAAETGVSHLTVQRDLAATGTDVPVVTGLDGKSRPAKATGQPWTGRTTQNTFRRVVSSLSAFVIAADELRAHLDGIQADDDDIGQIDAAIAALRTLKRQLQKKAGNP